MQYNLSEGKEKLIELISTTLGWDVDISNEMATGIDDFKLKIITPINNLTITIIGNLLFPEEYLNNVDSNVLAANPLMEPRGVKNRTVIFEYNGMELDQIIDKEPNSVVSKLFEQYFCELERKDQKFLALFNEENSINESRCWFENLNRSNHFGQIWTLQVISRPNFTSSH